MKHDRRIVAQRHGSEALRAIMIAAPLSLAIWVTLAMLAVRIA